MLNVAIQKQLHNVLLFSSSHKVSKNLAEDCFVPRQ